MKADCDDGFLCDSGNSTKSVTWASSEEDRSDSNPKTRSTTPTPRTKALKEQVGLFKKMYEDAKTEANEKISEISMAM